MVAYVTGDDIAERYREMLECDLEIAAFRPSTKMGTVSDGGQ
jgi:hypothetical protein